MHERDPMIYITRLDHNTMVVNAELIATVESTPDTMLTLSNGHQFLVRETVAEVVAQVLEYRRQINGALRVASASPDPGQPGKT
jgi:flagellar protein FlbD